MSFASDMRRWAGRTGQTMNQAVRSVQLQVVQLNVEKTPVRTGQAKGGWHASIGSPSGQIGGTDDKTGNSTIARARSKTQQVGDIFYFVNNLPYILDLEYGRYGTGPGATSKTTRDGYSIQAPNGMVRVSVQEIRAAIRSTIRDAQR